MVEQAGRDVSLRTRGRVRSVEEFNGLVLAERDGQQVLLQDVGYAEDGAERAASVANQDAK